MRAKGWLALLVEEPDEADFDPYVEFHPYVLFYFPLCAQREFERAPRRGLPYT